jgi:UDP:flavonoid glycosyltransferase YjiC (YdhE family)
MLIMPYSHDQPDNARRVRRLGVAKVIQRDRYRADTAASLIREILAEPKYRERAAAIGVQVRDEDGLREAGDALEQLALRSGSRKRTLTTK